VVRSAAEGVVAFAGRVGKRGVVVVVTGGWRASYEPVAASVSVGEQVAAGQPLGVLDPSGGHCAAPAPCLHWGLRAGERYLDPRWLLAPPRPVLLPLLRQ
jgi:murein DD-endopeptidase MepM/ murein hydrolase activator NlpD